MSSSVEKPLDYSADHQFLRRDALITAFCHTQLQAWSDKRLSFIEVVGKLEALMVEYLNIFTFEIREGTVSYRAGAAIQALIDSGHRPESVRRADVYQRMLTTAVSRFPLSRPVAFGIDVGDKAAERLEVPVFSFQKRVGEANPLLPDMEIVDLGYLEMVPPDPVPYDSKQTRAVFSGSTSGKDVIAMDDLATNAVPRIRAARFFRDTDLVDFRLPNIVQCESDEVAQKLREEGFGGEQLRWADTFHFKFQLSMDGNGAPCSRPAVALRSNSALMRYTSDYVLYYSSGLIPWLHYIPIQRDSDVLVIVHKELAEPGLFAGIAEAGRSFAENVLTRDSMLTYTGALLRMYSDLFEPG